MLYAELESIKKSFFAPQISQCHDSIGGDAASTIRFDVLLTLQAENVSYSVTGLPSHCSHQITNDKNGANLLIPNLRPLREYAITVTATVPSLIFPLSLQCSFKLAVSQMVPVLKMDKEIWIYGAKAAVSFVEDSKPIEIECEPIIDCRRSGLTKLHWKRDEKLPESMIFDVNSLAEGTKYELSVIAESMKGASKQRVNGIASKQ